LLAYFRINDPYRLLGVLVILLLVCVPRFIDYPGITYPELKSILIGEKVREGSVLYAEVIDHTAPLSAWINGFFSMIFGRSLLARHIMAMLIIFFQAAFLGSVLIDKKAYTENTYIPSLIFALLSIFSFDALGLSPELMGCGVLLLALNNLFREIEFRDQSESSFSVGIFISLASLFVFAFSAYLLAALAILAVFTRSAPRRYLLLIFGFLLPHFLLMAIYYLMGNLGELWQYFYLPNLAFGYAALVSAKSLWMLMIIPSFFLLISIVFLNREARFTKYQSQLVSVMFFWLIFSLLVVYYTRELRPQSFIVLIPSVSFFIAHFLLLIRRRKFAEINAWVIMISIIGFSFLAQYGKIDAVDYKGLMVTGSATEEPEKKVLNLSDNLSVYQHNPLGTGFLNYKLSRAIFEQPEYYENITKVYSEFQQDPPDVILDPENRFEKFMARIPEFRKSYRRNGEGRYIRTTVSN